MCELLGISFNHPVRPIFSFPGLLEGAWYNWDGWGLGFYPEASKSAQVFKEPYTGVTSDLAAFLQNYQGLRSDVFIGHIRKASRGDNIYDNTHPFSKDYCNRSWLFCHNGTLAKRKMIQKRTYFPVGDTDSELAFCSLLNSLKVGKIKPAYRSNYIGFTDSGFDYIYKVLSDINGNGRGTFNCLFSDGTHLFSYRDKNGARPLLYLHRQYPFHSTILRDSDLEIDLQVMKGKDDEGYIVASQPLSSEKWKSFRPGELIVFRAGKIVARRQQHLT